MTRPSGRIGTHQELLIAAARAGTTTDFEKSLEIIAAFGVHALKCDGVAVLTSRADERSVVPVAVVFAGGRSTQNEEGIALRLGRDSVISRAMEQHVPVMVLNDEADITIKSVLEPRQGSAVLLQRMEADTGPVGVMVFSWSPRATPISGEELELVSMLAGQAAANVVRGRLFRELERSEEKFRMLTENATDVIFTLDSSGRFTYLSPRAKDILGYDPADLVGTYYSDLVTPSSWEASQDAMRRAARDGKDVFAYEWAVRSQNGAMVYLEVKASFLRRMGSVTGQQGTARDVTERRRMQAQIRRRERELSQSLRRQSEMHDYVALVTQAQEDERKRIARELHDDTVQALVAIVRQLEILSGEAADTRRARERMQEMMALADNTLASLRRFTRDLRPPVLDDLGLEAALWWLTASFRERTTMTIDLESRGPAGRLLPATEVALYRIAQEALNNAEKHSSARRVTVILEYLPDEVRLSIQDDGAGFAVPGKKGKSALGNAVAGLGILGMQERAQLLGGSLDISSTAGEGTIVTARIPSSRPQ